MMKRTRITGCNTFTILKNEKGNKAYLVGDIHCREVNDPEIDYVISYGEKPAPSENFVDKDIFEFVSEFKKPVTFHIEQPRDEPVLSGDANKQDLFRVGTLCRKNENPMVTPHFFDNDRDYLNTLGYLTDITYNIEKSVQEGMGLAEAIESEKELSVTENHPIFSYAELAEMDPNIFLDCYEADDDVWTIISKMCEKAGYDSDYDRIASVSAGFDEINYIMQNESVEKADELVLDMITSNGGTHIVFAGQKHIENMCKHLQESGYTISYKFENIPVLEGFGRNGYTSFEKYVELA